MSLATPVGNKEQMPEGLMLRWSRGVFPTIFPCDRLIAAELGLVVLRSEEQSCASALDRKNRTGAMIVTRTDHFMTIQGPIDLLGVM